MKQVNIHEAKTHLSSLVEKAAEGESFIIAKSGRPLVTVNPYIPPAPHPRTGFLKDKITVPPDFDSMGADEIASLFEGGQ
jgi:prevent-host-death family protein